PLRSSLEGNESLLQPFCKILSQLVHLWLRDVNDIRLVRIPRGVILVVLFRRMKGLEGLECCDNRVCEDAGFVQLTNVSFGNPLLLVVGVKNRRAILPPDVVTLPIQLSGIVRDGEMDLEQLPERRLAGVVPDLDGFGMIRPAATHGSVICSSGAVTGVTVTDGNHSA